MRLLIGNYHSAYVACEILTRLCVSRRSGGGGERGGVKVRDAEGIKKSRGFIDLFKKPRMDMIYRGVTCCEFRPLVAPTYTG